MNRHSGFSLLEVLVAFSILAISLSIILKVFGSGVNSAVQAEDYAIAVEIAESLLARTGVETALQPGTLQVGQSERFQWRVAIEPGPRQQVPADGSDAGEMPLWQLMKVRVEVSWGDDQRSLVLHTLKLMRSNPPQ